MSVQWGKRVADVVHKGVVGTIILFSVYAAVNFAALGTNTVTRFRANRVRGRTLTNRGHHIFNLFFIVSEWGLLTYCY
jgi:hypothetical protein